MKILFAVIFILISSNFILAQSDWEKWDAKNVLYALPSFSNSKKPTAVRSDFVSVSQRLYKELFSNLDGDNCAFYPSCSSFFVQAVHKTNFINGALLFIDRFTRDLNFAKGLNKYPLYKNGHFYDPVEKYVQYENAITN